MRITYPKAPAFLLEMPDKILFSRKGAPVIERWLKQKGKQRPTLLDLEAARKERRKKR